MGRYHTKSMAIVLDHNFEDAYTYTQTRACFKYTVWTLFCSRVLKKVKLFKPLSFPLKIVFGADFVSVFPLNILLHCETDNNMPKRLLFENKLE